ncbi:GNAT family N-acetyltransferase [Pontixanthobacter sp.]|uniref:GNAT family N-acetyltransferase n=1 Tax=Pontixanthobacter sp. TaxID=2792078 RepID=UPI003C7AF23A
MSKKLSPCTPAKSGPFGRAEWAELLVQSGAVPLIAAAHDGSRSAALPLMRANGRLEPLANWYNFTWEPAGSLDAELLRAVASALRTQTHRVTVWPVPDEHGAATMLETAFTSGGWSVTREACDHNHVLEVNNRSFDTYWASRSGRMRTTLKRKAKKVDVTLHDHFDAEAWAAYEEIYRHSWKPKEGDTAMLRAFARQEGAAGRIRLAVALNGALPVAAQFWTVENGTAYIHKLAHLEEHKQLSAGTTLTAALFKHVIDTDRVTLVDFGTGDDAYKRDWMEMDRPRYRLDCLDPRQPKAWPALAKRALPGLGG